MNGSNIIEQAVFTRLAEEISKQIDYEGIAAKVAPAFKKRLIDEAKRQLEEDVDFDGWISDVMNNNVLDDAMQEVAKALADGMLDVVRKSK